MRDVILTTDLYHQHADPNDHWNLACMFSLAYQGYIRLAGIMCDDDRALKEDGSYFHFGDPSVQSIAQLNYITGMAVPVGFGSRTPVKSEDDIRKILASKKRISSVTLLLDTLERSEDGVDIHMCGSCKDVLIAYRTNPELFERKCNCIYLNAGTYARQEPIEYNVSLEPYAYSQIFKIPVTIRWSPCFDELRPWPYKPSRRANFYEIQQSDMLPYMSEAIKKYFNYMYGKVQNVGWLSYLKAPLDTALIDTWSGAGREMWSTPGFLRSASLVATTDGKIAPLGDKNALFDYKCVRVDVSPDGKIAWQDVERSNVYMFENVDASLYYEKMSNIIKELLGALPDIK